MGHVKRLLFSTEIAPEPAHYAGKRSIEHAETMHVHERNVRMEWDSQQFQDFACDMRLAETEWRSSLGGACPKPGAPTTHLVVSDIPGSGVTPTRFEVEETEYPTLDATTIHVHYRNLRLELSHQE